MNLIIVALAAFLIFPQVAYEGGIVPKSSDLPPIMERIAFCESSGSHFDQNGNVLKGDYNKYDIGKYQINFLYWGKLAKELGHDIYTEKGNEAMALELFKRYGTEPWKHSRKCWNA